MKSRYPYPWFYGCMSLCIPGLGQFMLGRKLQGCLFFLIQITASVTAYFVLISETFLGLIPAAALILAAYLFIPLNAIHAARIAKKITGTEVARHDCWLSIFLFSICFIISSALGLVIYLYLKRWMVFILSLGIIVTLAILTDNPFITSAAELVFMIVIPTHICYLRSPRDWKSAKYLIVFLALSTIGIVAGFYLQHYRYHTGFLTVQSTSGSMEPTFLENDFSIVNNFAYRRAAAQRGDIITFKKPTNQYPSYWTQADLQQIPDLLCKRVVGMEGDYVELTQDCIRVNGKIFRTIPKEQLWDEPQWRTDPNTWPYRTCRVPKGCCYVVGDHYFNSADSRTFGPIKNDTVLGKVVKTFWPLSRARLLMKH